MKSPVRIAQIGVGGMGRAHVNAVQASQRAELVAACDAADAALAGLDVPCFHDLETMLDAVPCDALICCLPHDLYPPAIELAARRGIHVLKEKPFARDLTDALRIHAAVEQAGIKFLCGAQRQYAVPWLRAKELLDSGEAGQVFMVTGNIHYLWQLDSSKWSWRGQQARSGGIAIVDSGWHILDALYWMKGLPSSVYCRVGNLRAGVGEYNVDDKAVLAFDFPDGSVGCVTACYLTVPGRFELSLHGTQATLELSPSGLTVYPRGPGEPTVVDDPGTDAMAAQLEHFLDVLLDDVPPRVGVDEALQVQRIVEAAYESASTGARVDLA